MALLNQYTIFCKLKRTFSTKQNKLRNSEEIKIKMKLFQTVQKNMAAMGFFPNQQQNGRRKLTFGQILSVFLYSINVISFCIYISCVANTIEEYIDSIFSSTVIVGIEIAFISIIFKNDKLFRTIENAEKEANDSM